MFKENFCSTLSIHTQCTWWAVLFFGIYTTHSGLVKTKLPISRNMKLHSDNSQITVSSTPLWAPQRHELRNLPSFVHFLLCESILSSFHVCKKRNWICISMMLCFLARQARKFSFILDCYLVIFISFHLTVGRSQDTEGTEKEDIRCVCGVLVIFCFSMCAGYIAGLILCKFVELDFYDFSICYNLTKFTLRNSKLCCS